MSEYLFAYGTLQPGCAPAKMAHLAAKLRPVGKGSVRGVLYDLGRYPGAAPDADATTKIAGTVMELPDDADFLARLDAYEGYDPQAPEQSEYVRERQVVEMEAGGTIECWFYRYNWNVDGARAVASGKWEKQGLGIRD
jgi:gamma-glutamylcyclotransferase (GGCT)/AIG2-like uncharacterized protein YtfP